ncbi:MAG: hypothetical protein H0W67_05975, partial [Gemmatimonadales bacterium]|nr:hypothetical protein [Gemmatimonadales bacterium]
AHLHFAVLSDFTDARTERRDGDDAILQAAVEGVRALNARYAPATSDAFYLFHRPRQWNPSQGVWMGWERKRGKLAQFNQYVRGGASGAFTVVEGARAPLSQIRYVITLDSDTVLPPDAAPLLVGTIAHPLNRAVYDPARGRVESGYGIIQPRVGISLPSAHRSHFAAINSGHPGVDPYTTAVSDVYQDLYGEGSFTGKGIYDLDAFEQATAGRFPENTLLSHDLIEGSYARAGLATDVIVYDDYPSRYLTYTRRKHRWIRGDWQLLRWMTPRVPGPDGWGPNRLSLLSRWKIFDNLRRSLLEIAELAFIVAGWTILPGSPVAWTLLGIGAIAAPWLVSLFLAVIRPPLDKSLGAYYAAVWRDANTSLRQIGFAIVFLPHQAWVSADAIVRTLWRLMVTRRNLLEWQTASQVEQASGGGAQAVWRTMAPAVVLALALLVIATVRARGSSGPALVQLAIAVLPLVSAWLASPALAHALSAPAVRRDRRLARPAREQAMRYALLHWRFFERFVTAETNWLAPDNFQRSPAPVVAMRTSPTNIGLQLLSTVSACDLGFITAEDMTRRLELALRSIERMRRFRGHLYNWYELHELHVLEPGYISTVDSGNLAGHLIALRQACLGLIDEPAFDGRVGRALYSALSLAADEVRRLLTADAATSASGSAPTAAGSARLRTAYDRLRAARATIPASGWLASSDALASVLSPLDGVPEMLAAWTHGADTPAAEWTGRAVRLATEHQEWQARLGSTGIEGVTPSLRQLAGTTPAAAELLQRLEAIAGRAHDLAVEMDFRFLYDRERELFAIGYQITSHALDSSYYDLLASEARLASFIAVAKDDVPVEHWFRLGRTLTRAAGETALVSWSGSMFEYLMPALVMDSLPFTVLDQTYRAAVRRQIAYGAERGVPWGVSESAYNLRDRHLTYQYRAFGVPDLALKRGLGHDLVVAPYASILALAVDPARALANLASLEKRGALGDYGFRDALDYTRPAPGERFAVVDTYMAHHIGMGFVALANALRAQIWPRRFHADPMVRSAELLLHERVPRRLVLQDPQPARPDEALPDPELERPAVREVETPDTATPRVALLGHIPYTIMVTGAGAGYSRYEDLAVTRWRADGTRDDTGQFCYLKDIVGGRAWSAAHQPVCAPADRYRAMLATDRVTFDRRDGEIETRTEIAVVAGDAAEVRRVTVVNTGSTTREIELTSYGEIVLAPPDSDRAHPAFANLFVETEYHDWCTAITSTRRPRSANERPRWCVHVVDAGKHRVGTVSCETDRARFLGRGRSVRNPITLEHDGPLSGTTGAVLDPIFALRTRVRLTPGQSASVAFTTLVADSRVRAFELADRYHDPHAAQRALDLAWTSTQIELRSLDIAPAEAAVFQELAGHLFFGDSDFRAGQDELRRNRGSQAQLWSNGISGDWPILLATIDSAEGLPTMRQLLVAHQYWRRRGMMVDLVVLNILPSGYAQELNEKVTAAVYATSGQGSLERPGGVFLRRPDILSPDDLRMLRATARLHVACDGRALGRLLETVETVEVVKAVGALSRPADVAPPSRWRLRRTRRLASAERRVAKAFPPVGAAPRATRRFDDLPLAFDNGLGGVTAEGDYLIRVTGDSLPPAPWSNVIANPRAGFLITERGGGFTWAENSYFFRLTPWSNDPVADPAGEAIYLRDEDTGELWSATPAPASPSIAFTVRHGPGVSSFEHFHGGIAARLTLGIARDDAVKIALLRLTNREDRPRRIAVTAYAEWALGVMREHTQHQVRTTYDADACAIYAQNFFDPQFADHVAVHAISESVSSHTGDRREFLGRNGSTTTPAALGREAGPAPALSGTTGAGFDPCSALQCVLELAPGEAREIVVLLGAGTGVA